MTTAMTKKGKDQMPATLDFGADAGMGFDNQDSNFIAIPFINLLQALSPQITEEKYEAENPKPGMLFNTVTSEFIAGKTGVEFVPADTQRVYVEWVPRDSGGGLVAVHDPNDPETKKLVSAGEGFGTIKMENGNELIETFYVYGVLCEDELPTGMAVIPFTSTKIKVFKQMNTTLNTFAFRRYGMATKPPLFSHRLRLTTTKEKNNHGEFFNFSISPAVVASEHDGKKGHGKVVDTLFDAKIIAKGDTVPGLINSMVMAGDERYEAAKSCLEMVRSGAARADYDSQGAASDGASGGGDGSEVPF